MPSSVQTLVPAWKYNTLYYISSSSTSSSSTLFLVDMKRNEYMDVQFNIKSKKNAFIRHIKSRKH